MSATPSALRIPITGELRHPGGALAVEAAVELEGLAGVAAEIGPGSPVAVDLLLERVAEGIVVRGEVAAGWQAACSRCLEPVAGRVTQHVDELFEREPLAGETYQLGEEAIDLEPMVRDAVLLDLPLAPLCDPDCEGLCPSCGANRNQVRCECTHEQVDERWAALRSLEL
jgi:DUF177 domain-containing protein